MPSVVRRLIAVDVSAVDHVHVLPAKGRAARRDTEGLREDRRQLVWRVGDRLALAPRLVHELDRRQALRLPGVSHVVEVEGLIGLDDHLHWLEL